jgi:hypothetical protein
MHRRRFLQSSLFGISTLSWLGCAGPRVLATQEELTQPTSDTPLAKAEATVEPMSATPLARAKAAGKPLLVLLVPKDPKEQEYRGNAYGYFLSESDDKEVALLGLCEIVCASYETLVGMFPEVTEDDWMVLLETDAETNLPAHVIGRPSDSGVEHLTPMHRKYQRSTEKMSSEVSKLLQRLLFANDEMRAKRANQCRLVLSSSQQEAVASYLKTPSTQPLAFFDQGAALLLANTKPFSPKKPLGDWSSEAGEHREAARKPTKKGVTSTPESLAFLVASAATQRLLQTPPEGSKWDTINADGCPMCGMGNIPPVSRKFLRFLTELPEAI